MVKIIILKKHYKACCVASEKAEHKSACAQYFDSKDHV